MSALDDWVNAGTAEAPAASKIDAWVEAGDPKAIEKGPKDKVEAPEGGFLRSLGLGTRAVAQGVGGLGGMLYDAASIPQNLVNAGVKAATGRDLGISIRSSGGERLGEGLDALGLPRPETVGEQRTGRVIEGMAGVMPTMGAGSAIAAARPAAQSMGTRLASMLTAAPATQLASGAGAGGAAQLAEEQGAGALGQFGAGLLGGIGGAAIPQAAGMAARIGTSLAQPFMQGGREGIVRDTLLRQSSDPGGLPGRLMASKIEPSLRLPDSPVTTAQATRDPGLAMLESGLRSNMTSGGGVGELTPAARFANIDTARNAARVKALPEPMPEAAAARGSQLRGTLEEAAGERRAQTSGAYEAIDPDNTSRIPIGGVRQAMDDLSGKFYGAMSGGMPRELQALADDLGTASVVPYNSVQNLHARIVRLQNELGTDPRAQSVLIGLKTSLDDAAERAALPHEPVSVPSGPRDIETLQASEGAAQRPDVAEALRERAGPAPEAPPWERTDGRAANADGSRESLASFIVRNGGVRDDGGEIMQTLGGTTRTRPGLLNSRGMPLDRMRELAQQEGYIGKAGQDVNGQHGTSMDDFVTALADEMNGPKRAPRDSSLGAAVDQELDQQHGLGLNSDPNEVLRAVRDPNVEAPAGAPVPDGYAAVPDAFTPEQAAQWRQAQEMRRTQGQDFSADQTGTRAVSTILQRGQGGGFNVPDQQVMSQALSGPNAARQAIRAGGEDVLPTLRGGFMDRAFAAAAPPGSVPGADGNTVLRGPGFLKFMDGNRDLAGVLFPSKHLASLERLAADFEETQSTQAMARARGSDTARNLSVANVVSMVSRGLIDPNSPAMQKLLAPVGKVMQFTGAEADIRRLLTDAMADPELATRLLARATPEAMTAMAERAAAYTQQTGAQRVGRAAGDAAGRVTLRAGEATEGDSPARRLPAMPLPVDPEQQRRNGMAKRLGL